MEARILRWEYKGKHKDLNAAYASSCVTRETWRIRRLLVTCDQERFEIHTNFTGTRPQVYSFTLDDLLSNAPTAELRSAPLDVLRAVSPTRSNSRPEAARARVTEQVAAEFAKLADSLERAAIDPQRAAHFLMRLLFCLFADSIGLLPDHLFRQMIELDRAKPANFTRKLRQLFAAMSTSGSTFGAHDIHYFNGGLFADDEVFDLTLCRYGQCCALPPRSIGRKWNPPSSALSLSAAWTPASARSLARTTPARKTFC